MTRWSPPAPIENDALHRLGERMGCDFTSAPRRAYLDRWVGCDVQAAPGSGKTTLLTAKLVHLAQNWPFENAGVCVLSHTNVARHEIQSRVSRFPETARLLAYPNYVGTLTTFFHTFLALPLLRGLGWTVTSIDNDTFAKRAIAKAYGKPLLRRQLESPKIARQITSWLSNLTLADDFTPGIGAPPNQVEVAPQPRLPKPTSGTGVQLRRLKAELIADGVFRFADMLVLARRALQTAAALGERLAARFPLIILDEAQDTAAAHLQLLDRIAGDARCVLQRIGDCNQAILRDADADTAQEWSPGDEYIDLGESLRFGPRIARLASCITCRKAQNIHGGASTNDSPPHVLLVTKGSEPLVAERFAQLVAQRIDELTTREVWALGWIHSQSDSPTALRLSTYFTSYAPPQHSSTVGRTLLGAVRAELGNRPRSGHCDLAPLLNNLSKHLRNAAFAASPATLVSNGHRPFHWLDEMGQSAANEARSVVLDLLRSDGNPSEAEWTILAARLRHALHRILPLTHDPLPLEEHLAYSCGEVGSPARGAGDPRSVTHDSMGRTIRIQIGTIASAKGRTHDATLVVETTNGQVRDACTALEVVTGTTNRDTLAAKPLVQKAVMNLFVAATRPRHLLCIALAKTLRSEKLRKKLEAVGISVSEVP